MKIIFLDEYSIGGSDLSAIKSQGEYYSFETTSNDTHEIVSRLEGAEVAIVNKVVMSREVISQLPHLRLICVAATGMNNIDHDAAQEYGVKVRNAVGYSSISVAEATLSAALSLSRETSYYDRYIKSGDYSKADRLFCFDREIGQLYSKNWGIIGLGAIGRRVAHLAEAFGCSVRYASTSGCAREEQVERAESITELLRWSDIISIHSPLNSTTSGLIGHNELKEMRKNAIIINVARGGIIDESALAEALNNNIIQGAALDVFSNEPLEQTSPLLTLNNSDKVLLTPHNAWQSSLSVDGLVAAIAKNIDDYRATL